MTRAAAEAACATGPSTWRFDAAGPLYRIRAREAEGYSFTQAKAMTMAEPGIAALMQRLSLIGCPIPTDLTQLTTP